MDEKLDSESEKILYYLRDKQSAKSSRIEENINSLDRNAVNYRIRKLRNLGLISSQKDRDSTSGSAKFAKEHYPNLNKVDEYEKLFGKLDVPESRKTERYEDLVERVEKLENSNDDILDKIHSIKKDINYIKDWIKNAEKHWKSLRMYFKSDDEFDELSKYLDDIDN